MTMYKSEMKKSVITEEDVDRLKIMAHPIRLQIINELIQYKKCNVTQLTELLKIPQSTVSQHLSKMRGKVLKAERKGLEMYNYITNLKASQIVGIFRFVNKQNFTHIIISKAQNNPPTNKWGISFMTKYQFF